MKDPKFTTVLIASHFLRLIDACTDARLCADLRAITSSRQTSPQPRESFSERYARNTERNGD